MHGRAQTHSITECCKAVNLSRVDVWVDRRRAALKTARAERRWPSGEGKRRTVAGPERVPASFKVSPDTKNSVDLLADALDMEKSRVIEAAVERYLGKK